MNIRIEAGLHSSEKDHTKMTGGTLSVDKSIHVDWENITLYTYILPLFPSEEGDDFHKALHTLEHLFAYTKDTGSIRSTLAEVLPGFDGKMVLDVSPYYTANGYGLRLTSIQKINSNSLVEACGLSCHIASTCLGNLSFHITPDNPFGVPFATAKECGQFTFHNPSKAQDLLDNIDTQNIDVQETVYTSHEKNLLVCDLRLLKPRVNTTDMPITLTPRLSYELSQKIETAMQAKHPDKICLIGTFGCMTGMYLIVSWDITSLPSIHADIMSIIHSIPQENLSQKEREEVKAIEENYKLYAEK